MIISGLISVFIEIVLCGACIISYNKSIWKKQINQGTTVYQSAYLIAGLLCSFFRLTTIFSFELNYVILYSQGLQSSAWFINPNSRIFLALLSFYMVGYFILYFSRFSTLKAVQLKDKVYIIIIHALLYIVPIMFIVFLYFGPPNNGTITILSYLNNTTLPYIFMIPEAVVTNYFLNYIYLFYFLLSLLFLVKLLNSPIEIKISYILFIANILIRGILSLPFFVDDDIILIRYLLSFVLDGLFISLIITGRRIANGTYADVIPK
jgi:hypothetical protein